jgi:hypothetical protein
MGQTSTSLVLSRHCFVGVHEQHSNDYRRVARYIGEVYACGVHELHSNDYRSMARYVGRVQACGVHELHSNDYCTDVIALAGMQDCEFLCLNFSEEHKHRQTLSLLGCAVQR